MAAPVIFTPILTPPLAPALLALLLGAPADPPEPPAAACGEAACEEAGATDPGAAAALARWERRTRGRIPVSAAARAAVRFERPDAPEELLELAAALRGPVDAAALRARYDWRAVGDAAAPFCLTATPRDPLARAFTPRLTVWLTPDGTPRSVENHDADASPTHSVALPAPPRPVRTASVAPADYVIRGQSPEPRRSEPRSPEPEGPNEPSANRRAPVRTALFTEPAGDRPAWRLERRLKTAPATRLASDRTPLTAPKPR